MHWKKRTAQSNARMNQQECGSPVFNNACSSYPLAPSIYPTSLCGEQGTHAKTTQGAAQLSHSPSLDAHKDWGRTVSGAEASSSSTSSSSACSSCVLAIFCALGFFSLGFWLQWQSGHTKAALLWRGVSCQGPKPFTVSCLRGIPIAIIICVKTLQPKSLNTKRDNQ